MLMRTESLAGDRSAERVPPARPSRSELERIEAVVTGRQGWLRHGAHNDYLMDRLQRYIAESGRPALAHLLVRAERGDKAAQVELRNLLAINYTYFWREQEQFQYLLEHLLPKVASGMPLRLWSAGCSTGEEAWSMAMAAREAIRLARPEVAPDLRILATDLDERAIQTAARGRYPAQALARVPEPLRQRYWVAEGDGRGGTEYLPRAELRALIEFAPLDLMAEHWPWQEPFDAIFCRNVVIYFADAAVFHLFERFAGVMKPDALLFTSRVEGGINRARVYFDTCGDSVFRLNQRARGAIERAGTPRRNAG